MSAKVARKKISAEELKTLIKYNPDDGSVVWIVDRRGGARAGDNAGTKIKDGYLVLSINNINYTLSNVVYALQTGKWPEKQITYKDGDKLNLKWENLILVSNSRKSRPKTKGKRNTIKKDTEIRIIISATREHWRHCRERNIELLSMALKNFLEANWEYRFIKETVSYFDSAARSAADCR